MNIKTTQENNKVLFDLYDVGLFIGYSTKAKGKEYPHKTRIDKIINNSSIDIIELNSNKYIDIDGIRKMITFSHSEKKTEFIEWLKKNQYIGLNEVFLSTRKESEFFDLLEKVLEPLGYTLQRQYIENKYRFDAYIEKIDTVIEYDENNHNHYNEVDEITRENYINNNHKYLIRVNDLNDLYYNIGYVIKKIIQNIY